MTKFSNFWADLGWMANLITVISGLLMLYTLIKVVFVFFKKTSKANNKFNNIYNYVKNKKECVSIEKLKDRKIAIIDDQPENYPISYLQKAGFNITSYTSVSLSDYRFINNYDLIFLDITNVVKEDSTKGGFELIKRVRSEMTNVAIIGASSKRFDPTLTDFFQLADDKAKTPIDEKTCEELIIKTLKKHYSPLKTAEEIDKIINQSSLTNRQHKKIVNLISDYLNDSIDIDQLLKKASRQSYKVDTHKLSKKAEKLKELL
jgi:FixJ family two-component response regulator